MKYLRRINEDIITDDEEEELRNISIDLIDLGFSIRIESDDKSFRSDLRSNDLIFHKKMHPNSFGNRDSWNTRYKFVNVDIVSKHIQEYGDLIKEVCDILPEMLNRIEQLGFKIANVRYGSSDMGTCYVIIKIKKEYISK